MKKWALIVVLSLFGGALFLRSLRKKRTASLVALSKGVRFAVKDLVVGKGPEATHNKVLLVHYVGRLLDGRVFDSSHE